MTLLKQAKKFKTDGRKPAIASYITILVVLGGGALLFAAFSFFIVKELQAGRGVLHSIRALYAAESGLEDTLLRLRPGGGIPPPSVYNISIDGSTATVTVGSLVGGNRTISSDGLHQLQSKRIAVTTALDLTKANFFFGAQVGEGGLVMGNNAEVDGNVFSNGDITAGGGALVTGTAKVAHNGNKLEGPGGGGVITIGQDAWAHTLKYCTVNGIMHYVSGGSIQNCDSPNPQQEQPGEIQPVNLPIGSSTVLGWKDAALAGGTTGALSVSNNDTVTLGPKKIEGDITLGNGSTIIMTGTLWATGSLYMGNNSVIKLDSSYGSLSGVIIFDGKVEIKNNGQLFGTSASSSFLMAVSERNSLDPADPAVDIFNSAAGAIFYTNTGLIHIHNTVEVNEVTGYKIQLDNSSKIQYRSGLADVDFTTGPSGNTTVVGWQELP